MPEQLCAKCGHSRKEHSYNGACYGICGEFVSAQGKSHTQALPASTAEQAAAKRRTVRSAAEHANELYGEDPSVPAKWLDVFTYCYEELAGAPCNAIRSPAEPSPAQGTRDAAANMTAELLRIKNRFDTIFNNVLCDMKPGYDDSIEGFNKGWDVARDILQEEIGRAAQRALTWAHSPAAKEPEDDWRDDPSADERWNAGVDFVMKLLCGYVEVDPQQVRWDAATETVDGDVSAVIGNIFRAKWGDDWHVDEVTELRSLVEGMKKAGHDAFMAMCAHRDSPDEEVFQDAIDALGVAFSSTKRS